MPVHLRHVVQLLFQNTGFSQEPDKPHAVITRSGSRPGDPLADVRAYAFAVFIRNTEQAMTDASLTASDAWDGVSGVAFADSTSEQQQHHDNVLMMLLFC